MNPLQQTLNQFLQSLGIKVPNSVIRELLETPVGTTLRGLSDALDSLDIENNVYQLPEEYLKELDYPYLMVLPNRKKGFAVITDDNNKEMIMSNWEGGNNHPAQEYYSIGCLSVAERMISPLKYLFHRNLRKKNINVKVGHRGAMTLKASPQKILKSN